MKNRAWLWLLMLSCGILVFGCSSTPNRDFSDADLLIDESVMPRNWALAERADKMAVNEGQESGAYINFYFTNTSFLVRGGEDIYRYSNSGEARAHYNRFERDTFDDTSIYRTTTWQTPSTFTFSSDIAARWRFACAGSSFTVDTSNESELCVYLAQYDEFLIFFSITTEVDKEVFITTDEIISIIQAIDQKMAEHLKPASEP